MAGCLSGKLRPVMRHKRIPLLCPVFNTASEPMLSRYDRLHRWEEPGAVCASLFHGFFRSDIAEASMSVIAVTNGDPERAQRLVDDMAEEIMRNRQSFTKNMPSVEEAVQRAMAAKDSVVLADISDNPGGGSTGDGTLPSGGAGRGQGPRRVLRRDGGPGKRGTGRQSRGQGVH